jgi:diguanylate cyclase (GGDEF)-like protein
MSNPKREAHEMLGLPLSYANQVKGVALAFAVAPRETFQPAVLDSLRRLTQQASLTVELANARTLAELRNPFDATTGLLSRERFFELADREFRRSWRFGEPLAVVELDVDDFTKLQRLLGPGSGEQVIQQVAGAVHPRLRSVDLLGRLDTDKLGAVVVLGTREQTTKIAERLRRAVAEIELVTPDGPWQVTASLGFATYPREQCASIHDLFALASQATVAAKRAGRNRVVGV